MQTGAFTPLLLLCLGSACSEHLPLELFTLGRYLLVVPHQGQVCWLEAVLTLLLRAEIQAFSAFMLRTFDQVPAQWRRAHQHFLQLRQHFRHGEAAGVRRSCLFLQEECCRILQRTAEAGDMGFAEDAACMCSWFYEYFVPVTTTWRVKRPERCFRCVTGSELSCECTAVCTCAQRVRDQWRDEQQLLLPCVRAPCGFVNLSAARDLINSYGYALFFDETTSERGITQDTASTVYEYFCCVEQIMPAISETVQITPDSEFRGLFQMCASDRVVLDIDTESRRPLLWLYHEADVYTSRDRQRALEISLEMVVSGRLFKVIGAILGGHYSVANRRGGASVSAASTSSSASTSAGATSSTASSSTATTSTATSSTATSSTATSSTATTSTATSSSAPASSRRKPRRKPKAKPKAKAAERRLVGQHFTCMMVDWTVASSTPRSDAVCLLLDSCKPAKQVTMSLEQFNIQRSQQIVFLLLAHFA